MSVIAICGLPGTGKTLFATHVALKHYKKDNGIKNLFRKKSNRNHNVIFSNYPIMLKKKKVYSNQVSLFDMARYNQYEPNSDYIYDEFQMYFDSLDFKDFSKVLRTTFQTHRHLGINNIFLISQHPSRIVKQARVLVCEFYEIVKFIKIPFFGIALFRYNIYYNADDYGKPVNVKKKDVPYRFKKKIRFFRYKKVFKAYDTKYMKKLVEDEDYLSKVQFNSLNMEKLDICNNFRI